jgi:hypothetical protein
MLEQLLIQQAALCWLKLNLVELSYSGTMKQSHTLTLGMYWEQRLSAAQSVSLALVYDCRCSKGKSRSFPKIHPLFALFICNYGGGESWLQLP